MESVKATFKTSLFVSFIHIPLIVILYYVCENSELPVTVFSKDIYSAIRSDVDIRFIGNEAALGKFFSADNYYITMKLGPYNVITLYLTLIGSFSFVLMAGYGLSSFPMSYLNSFLNRPIEVLFRLSLREMQRISHSQN